GRRAPIFLRIASAAASISFTECLSHFSLFRDWRGAPPGAAALDGRSPGDRNKFRNSKPDPVSSPRADAPCGPPTPVAPTFEAPHLVPALEHASERSPR